MELKSIVDDINLEWEPERLPVLDRSAGSSFNKLLTAFLLFIAALLLATAILGIVDTVPGMPVVAVSSLIVLFGMAVLYFYAYSFYDDRFYFWIAIAWLANAVYISWEGFADVHPPSTRSALLVFVLAQLYEIPFYIASYVTLGTPYPSKRIFRQLVIWFLAFGLTLGVQFLRNPSALKHGEVGFATLFLAVLFSMVALVRVGVAFQKRLRRDVHGQWSTFLPATFYFYASLQPTYFWKSNHFVLIIVFSVALLTKIFNSTGVFRVMLLDVGTLKQRLEIMQMWQDLGILTFAVEHDIKNPLQVISDNLMMMEQKYQANRDVINRIGSIRREMLRIFSTTEIIRTLRGGRRFYEGLMVKTSIASLFNRSIEAVKKEMTASSIRFIHDAKVIYVKAYGPQLQQVFVNILRNAVEAIREERPINPLIEIKYELLPEHRVAIRVSDNGCGIPDTAIPRLGKFYSTKTKTKPNSGIGLYVSTRILGFHDAHFEWKSKMHEGTEVSMIFPIWSANKKPKT